MVLKQQVEVLRALIKLYLIERRKKTVEVLKTEIKGVNLRPDVPEVRRTQDALAIYIVQQVRQKTRA